MCPQDNSENKEQSTIKQTVAFRWEIGILLVLFCFLISTGKQKLEQVFLTVFPTCIFFLH